MRRRVARRWPNVDPSGACLDTSMETVLTLQRRGVRAILQAGSASWPRVRPEQDDGVSATHFSYEWQADRAEQFRALAAGHLPEIHCWVGIPSTDTLIDLTTGDWIAAAAKFGFDWPGDPPPPFLYATTLPPRVVYSVDVRATMFALTVASHAFGERAAMIAAGQTPSPQRRKS